MTKTRVESPAAFQKFLSWLDQGVDSGGDRYVEMRRRLVAYFARKHTVSPDELADETLARVAHRLEEQGTIGDGPPARYCYIVARFVFLEHLRSGAHRQISLDEHDVEPMPRTHASGDEDDAAAREGALARLDRCLEALTTEDRALILEYYSGGDSERIARRRALAARLQLTSNALAIRACRIRETLEGCVDMNMTNSSHHKG